MIKLLRIINNIFSAFFAQVSGTQHTWQYEPDKRHIIITKKCKKQIKDLGLSEDYVYDVYTNGMKVRGNYMVKKYHGYEVKVLYSISPDTGKVVIPWIGRFEVR